MEGTNRENSAVAILAGGESRRMGADKAGLAFRGQTMLERIVAAARGVSDTVAVVGRTPGGDDLEVDCWLEDETPGLGPIGGLKTTLAHLSGPVVLLGCDMPLVDEAALRWLLEAAGHTDAAHGAVTTRDQKLEPLFSVYRPEVAPLVDEMIEKGRRSLMGLVEAGDFVRLEAPGDVADKLDNVNTPAQLKALRQRLDES